MAKVTSEKKYISFVKGLITEANALTFPENASVDEDNFDLKTNGSRLRRLGVDYEDGYALTATGIPDATLEGTKKSFHKWDFPGGATDISIGVIRAYNKFWFVNLLDSSPSASLLNGGNAVTITELADSYIETATINTYFIIVSSDLDLVYYFKYDRDTQLVSQHSFPIQIRDFFGVADALTITERPATLSDLHRYNLINQGWSERITSVCSAAVIGQTYSNYYDAGLEEWVTTTTPVYGDPPGAIQCTFDTLGKYPSNTDIWTLGKVGATTSADYQKYDPDVLVLNSTDNMMAPRGAHIIDAFKRGQSRRTITGITACPLDREEGRFSTVTSYAGRLVYGGIVSKVTEGDLYSPNFSGAVFFTQTVTGEDKLGKCYQEADPTSENISDILDTDGGIIQFPQISRIIRLVSVKDSLIVFAENGIWEIFGDTGGFKATNYQTANISTTGISNPSAVVVAGNVVVYWAKAGIFALVPNTTTGRYAIENLSLTTIQTYYTNSLSDIAKKHARGFYDEKENHIRWLYNDSGSYSETSNVNHYNKQLNLDLTLQAFYKFSISPLITNSPYVVDFIDIPSHAVTQNNVNVYSNTDNVLSNVDQVVIPLYSEIARTEKYSYLIFRGTSFTLGNYRNTTFMDWKTADGTGVDFSSYLVTGYDGFADIMRNKMVPYLFCYFTRTEDGFTTSGTELVANNPSSCLVQAQWNWADSAVSGKWGTQFQAYRYRRAYVPSGPGDTYDTGDSIIVTKNKLRGTGKALSLKIQSEQGKNMHLLGWTVIVNGDGTP